MSFTSWFRSLRRTPSQPACERRKPGARLTVELLEDRNVPASGPSASLVADLLPGPASSAPRDFAAVNGALYFSATDPTGNLGVYRSDGTAAGTTWLKSVGPLGAAARDYTALGSNVYFNANESLWRTAGTAAGTAAVGVVVHGGIAAMGGKLYFAGDGPDGVELWVSDGTKKGSKQVKDIDPTTYTVYPRAGNRGDKPYQVPNSSYPTGFVVLNNTLLFTASGGALWRSDGTSRGTTLEKDLPGTPKFLTVVGGSAYFAVGAGLWKTDGTTAGTVPVATINAGTGVITGLTVVSGTVYFAVADATYGPGLWKSDGTAAGTVPVKNVGASQLTGAGGRLYFTAGDAGTGTELWTSDGTTAGTGPVTDINPGSVSANPGTLTNVNGLLYFTADDGSNGRELWQSDGTAAGTVLVRDIYPGATGSDPAYLVAMNNKLYFAATDPDHGRELWDPPAVAGLEALLVPSFDTSNVLRFAADSGAFIDEFVAHKSGGLTNPDAVVVGPVDHDLYVVSGFYGGPGHAKVVVSFDGATGAFAGTATTGGQLVKPRSLLFGPDGNLSVADGQGVGTITDDEPRISISDVSKKEGKKNQTTQFTFTVTLSTADDQPVTMSYQTVNGTATTGDGDYVAKSGTLTFAPGETTKTTTIEVKGDSKKEANEIFHLDLFGLSSNALFTRKRGIGTILNDD